MIPAALLYAKMGLPSGKKVNPRLERIADCIFEGQGYRGEGFLWLKLGEPYVKDQAKLDEAKRLMDEEISERIEKFWNDMEKNGE